MKDNDHHKAIFLSGRHDLNFKMYTQYQQCLENYLLDSYHGDHLRKEV